MLMQGVRSATNTNPVAYHVELVSEDKINASSVQIKKPPIENVKALHELTSKTNKQNPIKKSLHNNTVAQKENDFKSYINSAPIISEMAQHSSNQINQEIDPDNFTNTSSQTLAYNLSSNHNPLPLYPESARRKLQEGLVLLDVLIDQSGEVTEVNLTKSSQVKALDQAAIEAVKKWQFNPAMANHKSVESKVQIPIRFKLK